MLTKSTEHSSEAIDKLVEQFKNNDPDNRNNLEKLLDVFSRQIQDLENVFFEILWSGADTKVTLDVATGDQLDGIGQIVGQERSGRLDDPYRSAIRAKILINNSSGTNEELLAIAIAITQLTGLIEITELPPASLTLRFDEILVPDPLATVTQLDSAKAAGVAFQMLYILSDPADVFHFASGDVLEASAAQGFGDDGQTTGGKMADVITAEG